MIDHNYALVDNDFLNHVLETRVEEEIIFNILSSVFMLIDKTAIIHPWIAEYEIMDNKQIIKNVISNSIIQVGKWDDIHDNDQQKEMYYTILFKELYKKVHGATLVISDIRSFGVRKQSLGELHNITTCHFCGCNLILSDDKDTKRFKKLISQTSTCHFSVYNRKELVKKVQNMDGAPSRTVLHAFAHKA